MDELNGYQLAALDVIARGGIMPQYLKITLAKLREDGYIFQFKNGRRRLTSKGEKVLNKRIKYAYAV